MEISANKTGYTDWLKGVKERIRTARVKVALAANSELLHFYWDLGKMISEKENIWGGKLIKQVSKDLQNEFHDMGGLSESNLKYCKRFYEFYSPSIGQQLVDQLQSTDKEIISKLKTIIYQIPWGHNILIFSKSDNHQEARFYIEQTIDNGWSRDVLALQIKTQLFHRQGKAIINFKMSSFFANKLDKPTTFVLQ